MTIRPALAVLLAAGLAASVLAGEPSTAPPAADPVTGRDLAVYAPDTVVEFRRMALAIDVPDMTRPSFTATQRLTVAPIAGAVSSLTLDAKLLEIASVSSPERLVGFRHDGQKLLITFDPPLERGQPAEVVTTYAVNDPVAGITWVLPEAGGPGPSRGPQLHSQGQSEFNSYWFPIHDSPNVRLSTELSVTVPAGYEALSNGWLVSRDAAADGRVTFRWSQERPHAPYLVSLVVGRFEVVDVAPPSSPVRMPVYVPPGRGRDAAATFARTPEMAATFARLFGEPYPWDKYAQAVVTDFASGGMENTSATTLYGGAVLSAASRADQSGEALISHELAHQWFGDLITCRSWAHLWLNEGFATYAESLWLENAPPRPGEAAAGTPRDAYLADVLANLDALAERTRVGITPMVSGVYTEPDEVFGKADNPYSKGAVVLHMLRERLGDELFFRGLRAYVQRFKLREVETGDLRRMFEDVTGESLEGFFRQWTERSGLPRLAVSLEWEPRAEGSAAGDLVVTVRQRQPIDGSSPAFEFALPLMVESGPGRHAALAPVPVSGREAVARYAMAARPRSVAIDPNLAVAAIVEASQPRSAWLSQLATGPSVVARVRAARELGRDASPEAASALDAAATDGLSPIPVRAAAVTALGARDDAAPLLELATRREPSGELRLALVKAAATRARDQRTVREQATALTRVLLTAAAGDPFPRTRAAALDAIGELDPKAALPILSAAADAESDGDRIRAAALRGLGATRLPAALPIAIRHALPGGEASTRVHAIEAVGALAPADPAAAAAVLAGLLRDRNREVWSAAVESLAKVDHPSARPAIETFASGRRDPADQRRIAAVLAAARSVGSGFSAPMAPAGHAWIPLGPVDGWADTPAAREAIAADPAAYFRRRGLVVAGTPGGTFLLAESSSDAWLTGLGALEARRLDRGVRDVIEVSFNPASRDRLRAFTRAHVGARLAVLVGGEVRATLPITGATPGPLLLPASGDARAVEALRRALVAPGAIELRLAAPPEGDQPGEASRRPVGAAGVE